MSSVTNRINEIKQPFGGYIKPSDFKTIQLSDGKALGEENVHSSIVGMAVDYLTRFMTGQKAEKAFSISLDGAALAEKFGRKQSIKEAALCLSRIEGLDDQSIIYACKLVTFDVWFRNPYNAPLSKGPDETNPDKVTIENIKTMVQRSMAFFKEYGPVTSDGFTFEPDNTSVELIRKWIDGGMKGSFGGYTKSVDTGDGDFLTKDTLWDFKVTKSKPTSKHTLQLLMYWIMGQHSGQAKYKSITKLGIFNPRLNVVYLLDIASVPSAVIKEIEDSVICY